MLGLDAWVFSLHLLTCSSLVFHLRTQQPNLLLRGATGLLLIQMLVPKNKSSSNRNLMSVDLFIRNIFSKSFCKSIFGFENYQISINIQRKWQQEYYYYPKSILRERPVTPVKPLVVWFQTFLLTQWPRGFQWLYFLEKDWLSIMNLISRTNLFQRLIQPRSRRVWSSS